MSFSQFHLYFDDVDVGQEWISGGRTITEADIVNFAGVSGDFNPIHIDHEFAKTTPFRRPIAHGFGIFSMASGLGVMTPPVRTIALLKVRYWDFLLPVFAGDTIRSKCRVVEKTLRGRGKRGEIVWYRAIINQDGKTTQEGEIATLIECRPLPRIASIPKDEEEVVPTPDASDPIPLWGLVKKCGNDEAKYNDMANRVMNRLGVPRELRGIKESGDLARHKTGLAFSIETNQGGANRKPFRLPAERDPHNLRIEKRGLNIDVGILDDNLLPFESWRRATPEQRMEAVVAHELAEYESTSTAKTALWRHADAIVRSLKNPNISPEARAIIRDQASRVLAGKDHAVGKNPEIIAMIEGVLERNT